MCQDARGKLISKLWKKIFSRSSGGSDSSLEQLCLSAGRGALVMAVSVDGMAGVTGETGVTGEDETLNDVDTSSTLREARSIHTPIIH